MDLTFLIAPNYSAYYIIRSIFLSFSTVLLLGIIYLLTVTGYLKTRWFKDLIELLFERPYGVSGTARRWNQIEGYLDSENKSKYKLAVMEAENLLGKTLEKIGYEGDNIEERLEQVPTGKIENLEEVKLAHELRNNVAYDPDYQLKKEEVEEALGIYRRALEDLEAI